jgi:hypothetical protein
VSDNGIEFVAKRKRTPSRKAAIDAFCKQCIYDPEGGTGTWRQQVEACTTTRCPLYPVRPVSTTEESA